MKQHLRRTAFLDFLPINRQIKMQLLNISKTFYRNKSTDCRRTIESFTEFPWSASFSETAQFRLSPHHNNDAQNGEQCSSLSG